MLYILALYIYILLSLLVAHSCFVVAVLIFQRDLIMPRMRLTARKRVPLNHPQLFRFNLPAQVRRIQSVHRTFGYV